MLQTLTRKSIALSVVQRKLNSEAYLRQVLGSCGYYGGQVCVRDSETHETEPGESYLPLRQQCVASNNILHVPGLLVVTPFSVVFNMVTLPSQVYKRHKDEDGFLYITYSGENTFGGR